MKEEEAKELAESVGNLVEKILAIVLQNKDDDTDEEENEDDDKKGSLD
jgi:hypothetical protein